MDRVRLGIIGTGNIAPLNVAGYLAHDRCDVVAVCDPRRDKARMAEAWGVPKVYDSLDSILADDEIDAVEILTPHVHAQRPRHRGGAGRQAHLGAEADRELGRRRAR